MTNDRITFVFGPAQSTMRGWLEQQKAWLDAAAERVAGRKIAVTSELSTAAPAESTAGGSRPTPPGFGTANPGTADAGSRLPDPVQTADKKRDLKAEAMSSSTVQAMLEVFPAEIRDVEEM